MLRTTVALDGLWYCLCPSFSAATLNRARVSLLSESRLPKQPRSTVPISSSQRRCHSSVPPTPRSHGIVIAEEERSIFKRSGHPRKTNQASHDDNVRSIPRKPPPRVPASFQTMPLARLESLLQDRVAKGPTVYNVTQILRTLIQGRHVHPEMRHYRGLIFANSEPERGSPAVVRELLTEMEANGIPADSGTLHAALQALAVHPDYILRQEILHTLRDRWLTLSPAGWHFVVAGLIREHQLELALDHIDQMERKGIVVEAWLHSMLVYYLCEFEEFDEVLRLMRSRTKNSIDMTPELWLYVLTVASAASHYETAWYIWRERVEFRYLEPPYSVCSTVLTLAARAGNVELATSVIRFLAETTETPNLLDYERMVEAHAVSGDLYSGFEVLCQMHSAGIVLEKSSTRAIVTSMIQKKILPRRAWGMLKRMRSPKRDIPLKCAEAVFEVCRHEAPNNVAMVDDGIALYKELYALCRDNPDASTYNILIGMCRRAREIDAAMFLVKEMAALEVVPDHTTYEHLVMMCLEAGNFESAYMYFEDMLEQAVRPSEEVRADIREICAQSQDHYATRLRYHPQMLDGSVGSLVDEISSTPSEAEDDSPQQHDNPFRRWGLTREEADQMMSYKAKRAAAKQRRKRKRRAIAIAQAQEEEGWMDYEPGGLIPEDQQQAEEENR
ncbi:pentatricopeptide repeat protein [Aspergillus ellipticus CBS 707.79]|uniref:Pentatricopeptide repeat protein n=1 Tax=Aspergillus ellipticus CBS 707.79 TaxID=1448320 RepID=A0A319DAF5_9EURO|nr:pentatricopeptide repeat protein [Aspergillus ellipticus CBS 707.79]